MSGCLRQVLLYYQKHILNRVKYDYHYPLTNFSTKYLVMCKIYSNVDGIKSYTIACPPVCGDNTLAKAHGLSQHTGGQAMDNYYLAFYELISPAEICVGLMSLKMTNYKFKG